MSEHYVPLIALIGQPYGSLLHIWQFHISTGVDRAHNAPTSQTSAEMGDLAATADVQSIERFPEHLGVFLYEKRKERLASELAAYMWSNDKYIDYLNLQLPVFYF